MLGPTSGPSSASEIGLLGKIPIRPDFVRWGARGVAAQLFDRWLVTAIERLRQRRMSLPTRALRFVWSSGDCSTSLVGVLAPSSDKLGRTFPIAVFREVNLATARQGWSSVPRVYEAFLGQTEALLGALKGLEWEQLSRALLELPGMSEPHADGAGDIGPGANPFLRAAFGDERSAQAYALLTLLRATTSAATSVRTRSPALACPLSAGADVEAWLALLQRFCPRADPSFVWGDGESRRLLFGYGQPPEDALCAICDPAYGSNNVWPLTTERGAALEHARTLLATQLSALESGAETPLDELASLMKRAKV